MVLRYAHLALGMLSSVARRIERQPARALTVTPPIENAAEQTLGFHRGRCIDDQQVLDELARPERFELPTFWFVGRLFRTCCVVIQLLAALATPEPNLSKSHAWHSTSELGTKHGRIRRFKSGACFPLRQRDCPALKQKPRRGAGVLESGSGDALRPRFFVRIPLKKRPATT